MEEKNDLTRYQKYAFAEYRKWAHKNTPNHEHRYNSKGECVCGKVLADIRPYPLSGGATPWTG